MLFYFNETLWSPKKSFWAIKVNGTLYPCTYQSDAERGKYEAFIKGIGWKKQEKGYEIPLFNGEPVDFKSYMNTYSPECLFYSVTGFSLDSHDSVVWKAKHEFNVMISLSVEYVQKFVEHAQAINRKIYEIEKQKNGIEVTDSRSGSRFIWKDEHLINTDNLYYVKPCYSIMAYFLTAPHVDVMSDDEKLWKHFIEVYQPKTEEEREKFPVCMSERMEWLWSKEVADMYESIMNDFPMTYKPD